MCYTCRPVRQLRASFSLECQADQMTSDSRRIKVTPMFEPL
jgi:hypothetical protein